MGFRDAVYLGPGLPPRARRNRARHEEADDDPPASSDIVAQKFKDHGSTRALLVERGMSEQAADRLAGALLAR